MARLRAEMARVLAAPDTRAKVNEAGPEIWIATPEEFAAAIRRDYEKNGKLVKALGIKLD